MRSLSSSIRRLAELGLVRSTARGRQATEWEVLPAVFGLADDDIDRRRKATSTRRRYVAFPFHLVGTMSPTELAVMIELLEACGSRPYSRLDAGEHLVATVSERSLGQRTAVSTRSVRRALGSLVDRGLIVGDVCRGQWIVEVPATTFGLDAAVGATTDLPDIAPEVDRFAEQKPALPIHVHEGFQDRRGARLRAAGLYPALLAIVYGGTPTVTTPSMRGRVAQATLRLALAGANIPDVDREGWRIVRETASPPRPEAVVDAVLAQRARAALRSAHEAQFSSPAAASPDSASYRLTPIPQSISTLLVDIERRAVRWQSELENGDSSTPEWRQLLGGSFPWEQGYVPIAVRGHQEAL